MRPTLVLALVLSALIADRYFYVAPKEGARAEAAIVSQIGKAENEIIIAMYSFTNGSIANALKAAAKRGVAVTIVIDEKNLRGNLKDSKAGELAKLRNVEVKIASGNKAKNGDYYGIMHLKVGVLDEKISVYGSANWTNSAFNVNHEIIFIDDDPKLAKEIKGYLEPIVKNAKAYRNFAAK
ncbi:MAG: phospholipase D-like domain-containing protein [Helicobacteraceae bacterium]|jgi:phosphatidylserine/phosphatidylglycerophosphate/cardiolipin synthase-like enzyme|nr:phospholipase D-like domain-containing protein [Helicobacteraceae bacterium]